MSKHVRESFTLKPSMYSFEFLNHKQKKIFKMDDGVSLLGDFEQLVCQVFKSSLDYAVEVIFTTRTNICKEISLVFHLI